jgi:hypothetical protein
MTHYFYFATRSVASAAAYDLERLGFDTLVRPSAMEKEEWLVLATKTSSDEPNAQQLKTLHDLALQFDGEYDGFEVDVI